MLSFFEKHDVEQAKKELACYEELEEMARNATSKGLFDEAITYHKNMIRSLEELRRLNNKKLTKDLINNLALQADEKDLLKLIKDA